jgi:HEPN domain-containing protein
MYDVLYYKSYFDTMIMNEREKDSIVRYWIETAKRDNETLITLFESGRYPESLFFGHIVIEKMIKGLIVKNTASLPPFTHDLIHLADLAHLLLSKEETNFLSLLNRFNIRARYPEYKLSLYKKCNKKFTEANLKNFKQLYKKLCQKLN